MSWGVFRPGPWQPPRRRALVAPLGAPAAPDPVTGLSFDDVHDLSADVSFTTTSAGYSVVVKEGSGLAAPTLPTDAGWVSVVEATAAAGLQALNVDLLQNAVKYTLAVFGWDGVSEYSSAVTVDIHALQPPVMLASARNYALVEVTADWEGLHLAVEFDRAADWLDGQAETRWETNADPSRFEVYDDAESAALAVGGSAFPPTGLPAGSVGKVVRLGVTRFYGIGRFRAYQA